MNTRSLHKKRKELNRAEQNENVLLTPIVVNLSEYRSTRTHNLTNAENTHYVAGCFQACSSTSQVKGHQSSKHYSLQTTKDTVLSLPYE